MHENLEQNTERPTPPATLQQEEGCCLQRGRERSLMLVYSGTVTELHCAMLCYKSQPTTVLEIYSVQVAQISWDQSEQLLNTEFCIWTPRLFLASQLTSWHSWPDLTWPDLGPAGQQQSQLSTNTIRAPSLPPLLHSPPLSLSPSIPSIPIAPHLNHSLNPSLSTSIRTLVTIVI